MARVGAILLTNRGVQERFWSPRHLMPVDGGECKSIGSPLSPDVLFPAQSRRFSASRLVETANSNRRRRQHLPTTEDAGDRFPLSEGLLWQLRDV